MWWENSHSSRRDDTLLPATILARFYLSSTPFHSLVLSRELFVIFEFSPSNNSFDFAGVTVFIIYPSYDIIISYLCFTASHFLPFFLQAANLDSSNYFNYFLLLVSLVNNISCFILLFFNVHLLCIKF